MPDTILSLGPTLHSSAADFSQPGTNHKDDPEKIHQAAQQFESLLLAQILKSAHDDSEGWLGTGEDQAGSSAMSIAEEQLAQALSNRGGLGLAGLIERGLTRSKSATDR
jgi:Rod binding domain-containing protein